MAQIRRLSSPTIRKGYDPSIPSFFPDPRAETVRQSQLPNNLRAMLAQHLVPRGTGVNSPLVTVGDGGHP